MTGPDLYGLPTITFVIIVILSLIQLVVLVWALVRLFKDNRERVVGLPRFAWALIIIFGQSVGPIVFLVLHYREVRAMAAQQEFVQMSQAPVGGQYRDASTVVRNLYED